MKREITILLAALALSCQKKAAPPLQAEKPLPLKPASWMEDHLSTLGKHPLNQIAMPASHDAAMYLSGFPQSLGKTQNLNIYGQLNQGVRYFDLRPKWHAGTIYLHHDIITGPRLDEVLDDVRKFMSEGHRELVILKFSHYDGFTIDHYNVATGMITAKLSRWLYQSMPPAKRLTDIFLSEYLNSRGTILAVCDGEYPVAAPHQGIWIYRDWDSADPSIGDLRVYDQYSNTMTYAAMKADQFAKFNRYDGRCKQRMDVPCDLFLLSWTLTPPTDVPAFAQQPNTNLANTILELRSPNPAGRRINLLYADCVESAHLAEAAMALNDSLH